MIKKTASILLAFLLFGCNSDIPSIKMDEGSLWNAPENLVLLEDLPEWLQEMLSDLEHNWSNDTYYWVQIHKGEWKNRTIYLHRSAYSSNFGYFFYEDGTYILLGTPTTDDIYSTSKNWSLIWKHGKGLPPLKITKSGLSYSIAKDKYEFPDISRMSDWERPNIIQDRTILIGL